MTNNTTFFIILATVIACLITQENIFAKTESEWDNIRGRDKETL